MPTHVLKWISFVSAGLGAVLGLIGIAGRSPAVVYLAMALFVAAIAATAVMRLRERQSSPHRASDLD